MAKASTLPKVNTPKTPKPKPDVKTTPDKPDVKTTTPPPEQKPIVPGNVSIELPIMHGEVGYGEERIDLRMTADQPRAQAVKSLMLGLQQAGETREDGRPINRPLHALYWLIDKIRDERDG